MEAWSEAARSSAGPFVTIASTAVVGIIVLIVAAAVFDHFKRKD